jgi:WD40 repeat protein
VASTQSGKYFATSSKDETIVVWQTEIVLQGQNSRGGASDPIVCILNEHEHVIDCIVWAPLDSARTIEYADYSGGMHSQSSVPRDREQENGSAIDQSSTLDQNGAHDDDKLAGQH